MLSSDSVVVPVVRSLKLTEDNEFVAQRGLSNITILDHLAKLKDAIKSVIGWHFDSAADADVSLERMAVEAGTQTADGLP